MTEPRGFLQRLVGRDVPAYALLDGARDPRVFDFAASGSAPYECLYAGNLPYELAEVAPYLVQLLPDQPLPGEILDAGWGESWGVFLQSTAPLETLRRHFRRFLRVKTEDGRQLLFRFYDPRVLRAYLPTCNDEELATFFGPVDRFLVEAHGGDGLDVYTFERGILLVEHFDSQDSPRIS